MEQSNTTSGQTPAIELLDGGTGEECFRMGVPDDRRIWSARALVEPRYHDVVRHVHESFILSGARYITTSNYAVTPGMGLGERISELSSIAGKLAGEARQRCDDARGANEDRTPVSICGSLPPLLESYRPDLTLEHKRAAELYRRIVCALHPHVDLFLAETMSSISEARSAVEGARMFVRKKALWVSFTVASDGNLRSRESAPDAVERMLDEGCVSAILFNCSEPEAITKALAQIQGSERASERLRAAGVRLGAYGNRLTAVPENFSMAESDEPQAMREDLDVARYAGFAREWAGLGATLIGGCCGIGPEYIRGLHEHLVEKRA